MFNPSYFYIKKPSISGRLLFIFEKYHSLLLRNRNNNDKNDKLTYYFHLYHEDLYNFYKFQIINSIKHQLNHCYPLMVNLKNPLDKNLYDVLPDVLQI